MFPLCRERQQIGMLWVEWFRRLKWHTTDLEASVIFFNMEYMFMKAVCNFSPHFSYADFFAQVMQQETLVEMPVYQS